MAPFFEERKGGRVVARIVSAILAISAGVINALFGGGGGLLVVPALDLCLNREEKKAHATAVAVMLPLSICSAVVLTLRGVRDVVTAFWVSGGTALGGLVGALLLKRMPKGLLSLVFGVIMIYAGVKYLK